MLQEVHLNKEEVINLFGEYCIMKCKSFSQNAITDKYKANIFLQCHYDFTSFREIRIFIKKAKALGFISANLFTPTLTMLEYFLNHNGYFNPAMDSAKFVDYFFSLTKRLANSTINQYIMCANLFMRFLNDKGYKSINLKSIKMNFAKQKKLPSFLNDFYYKAFLQEVKELQETSIYDIRKKLIILLVYYTGIRTREMRNLIFDDIKEDREQYIFKISGKCSQERLVSIKKVFIGNLMQKFLDKRKAMLCQSPFLFQLKNLNQPPNICINLKPILKKLNCMQPRGNMLHLLRHSFASFVYRESRDILLTQKALGHANISNTQIYIHMNSDVYEKVSSFF